ncbi:MAG: hypothetical protein HY319_10895 [Armatimonadetes bacterium]|nr:hypothetical protein [Armatimonadota bacterium]
MSRIYAARCWPALILGLLIFSLPTRAAPPQGGDNLKATTTPVGPAAGPSWDQVCHKIRAAREYSFVMDYRGPRGHYRFAYSAVPSVPATRTEILPGSDRGAGVVLVYDARRAVDCVFMDTGFLILRRSLDSRDLRDGSLEVPLYTQLLNRAAGAPQAPDPMGVGNLRFTFQDASLPGILHHLIVDSSATIVGYRQQVQANVLERVELLDVRWNAAP